MSRDSFTMIRTVSTYYLLTSSIKYSTIRKGLKSLPTVDKIIEKMKQQLNGIKAVDAEKVLNAFGYEAVRQKGSHKHYLNRKSGNLITIKQETPLKKVYVVDILKRIGE